MRVFVGDGEYDGACVMPVMSEESGEYAMKTKIIYDGIKNERLKEILKPKAYKEFEEWMTGQTTSINGVYEDDFLRWVQKRQVVD